MVEVRWCLDFCYAESSKRWPDGTVVFHPFSGDTFELNGLADSILCCLDEQPPQTTASLVAHLAACSEDRKDDDLPEIVGETLRYLEEYHLVHAL